MSNSIKSNIRKYLVAGVAKQAGVDTAQAKLDAARGGMYSCTVQAAIAAKGDKAVFIEAAESLMDEFRGNKRGIAIKYNMDQACDKQGNLKSDSDGNPVYKVPGSLSTAKSVLGKALDHAIDLGTIKDPGSFGSIRDAGKIASDEAAKATASPDDKVRTAIGGHLEAIGKQLAGMDTKSLKALESLLAKVAKGSTDARKASKKAA